MFHGKNIVAILIGLFVSAQLVMAQAVTQQAESQPVSSSGVNQTAYTNASGGYVLQAYGAAGWYAALKPGLTGRYIINVRTRAGYTSGNYYGVYNLSIDGQNLALTRDDSTKVWHSDSENYVWWKMTDLGGVTLTANSTGQVTGDWVWGFVDAYELVPVACEAEGQSVPSSGVTQYAYTNASGGYAMQANGSAGWYAGLKPGLTGRYVIRVRTRAGYTSSQFYGTYNLSIGGQNQPLTRDDSTKIWYSDNENYVWWKMTNANGVLLTANTTGQVTGDWVWGFVDAYEYVPVITREGEDENYCSSGGVFQISSKTNASGGWVYQQTGSPDIWPHYIEPGLSGWYMVEYRTRYGYDNQRHGDYSLKKDGVHLAAAYDPATIAYYDSEDNYAWWKADMPVLLDNNDRLDIASDFAWGFVDLYRFTPCWHRYIEAEDTNYCSTAGVWQVRSYTNASGGAVFQQSWSPSLWPHYVSPNVTGKFIVRVRTRFNYQSVWRPYGAISIVLSGQTIPLQYEIDTLQYYNDNENYIWWSSVAPVALTSGSQLQTTSQWSWDMIDAYDFIRVP